MLSNVMGLISFQIQLCMLKPLIPWRMELCLFCHKWMRMRMWTFAHVDSVISSQWLESNLIRISNSSIIDMKLGKCYERGRARKSEEEKRRNETGYWVFSRMAILRWKIQFSNKIKPWRHFKIDSGSNFFAMLSRKKIHSKFHLKRKEKRVIFDLWERERERWR